MLVIAFSARSRAVRDYHFRATEMPGRSSEGMQLDRLPTCAGRMPRIRPVTQELEMGLRQRAEQKRAHEIAHLRLETLTMQIQIQYRW